MYESREPTTYQVSMFLHKIQNHYSTIPARPLNQCKSNMATASRETHMGPTNRVGSGFWLMLLQVLFRYFELSTGSSVHLGFFLLIRRVLSAGLVAQASDLEAALSLP